MRTVVLDPGHGGSEPRALSTPVGVRGPCGTQEKELTLALARRIRARLEPHVRVQLTRDGDRNLSLEERAALARRLGASAFVSLHANEGRPGERGCETWVHPRAAESSRALAAQVQRAVARVIGPGRGVKSGGLSLLDPARLGTATDACMVELDYLSDAGAERRLRDGATLDAIAGALAGAVREHLAAGERYGKTLARVLAAPLPSPCAHRYEIARSALPASMALVKQHLGGVAGSKTALIIRSNEIRKGGAVDVAVHLHGYSGDGPAMSLLNKEPFSGLDFVDPDDTENPYSWRERPTVGILPHGLYSGDASAPADSMAFMRYTWPAFATAAGLQELIDFSLQRVAAELGLDALTCKRLVLTAHSGGGAGAMAILGHTEPDEVQLFDATYGSTVPLVTWMRARLGADAARIRQISGADVHKELSDWGGAMRVLYLDRPKSGTVSQAEAAHRELVTALGSMADVAAHLCPLWRVEHQDDSDVPRVEHTPMPRIFGFQFLSDAAADLSPKAIRPLPAVPCAMPAAQSYGRRGRKYGHRREAVRALDDNQFMFTQSQAVLEHIADSLRRAEGTRFDQVHYDSGRVNFGIGSWTGSTIATLLDAYLAVADEQGARAQLFGFFGGEPAFTALRDRFADQGAGAAISAAEQGALERLGADTALQAAQIRQLAADVKRDVDTIEPDNKYPFIDGYMDGITELAAHVLVHAMHQHGGVNDLIAAVVASHGGQAAFDGEITAGTVDEKGFLSQIGDQVVARVAEKYKKGVRARYDTLIGNYAASDIGYFFHPKAADAPVAQAVRPLGVDEQYQLHESAAVLAHARDALAETGLDVDSETLKSDLASVGNDGKYPYIDGYMNAISEQAAQVLVQAIHQHGDFKDLVSAVVAAHGGEDALGKEMVAGTVTEPTLLDEIAAQAVAKTAAANRPAVRKNYDKLAAYRASTIAYYFNPQATGASASSPVTPTSSYLPTKVRNFWGLDARRKHHATWHYVRRWSPLSGPEKADWTSKGWQPPHENGKPGAGLDFLGMHRQMVAHQQVALKLAGDPLYSTSAGWAAVPFDHADPDWPMPVVTGPKLLLDQKAQAASDGWKKIVADRFENDAWLATVSLDELGTEIEWGGMHGWLHYHWSSAEPASAVSATNGALFNDWLGHPFSSAANPAFWKLHGWIDDRIAQWESATGKSATPLLSGAWSGPMPAPPSALALSEMPEMDGMPEMDDALWNRYRESIAAWRFETMSPEEFLDAFPDTPTEQRLAGRRYGAANSYWPEKYPVLGIDVSLWDGKIDWNKVQGWKNPDDNPISFVFIKATEGPTTKFPGGIFDPQFERNWALASGRETHQSAAVLARLVHSLDPDGTKGVTRDDVKKDLESVSGDGAYPYIDGGMGAISEQAAQVLVHAIRQHGDFKDLMSAVVAKHGGSDKLGEEMVKALDGGKSIEPKLLKEIADEAVSQTPAADRPKARAEYDGVLKNFADTGISYYFSPGTQSTGILRSAYHFFHPAHDGAAQARQMITAIERAGGLRPEDLAPVVDFETGDGLADKARIANELFACLTTLETALGRTPFIYCNLQWQEWIPTADDARFARFPLWFARYDRGDDTPTSLDPGKPGAHAIGFATVWTEPPLPLTRYASDWAFWQIRIAPGNEIDGIPSKVDCDVFNGTRAQLEALTVGAADRMLALEDEDRGIEGPIPDEITAAA
ncbi:MAG TPA: N-acetylmuramoyl-L-alanine amidase [Myxococcales bacterium]|jgi:N-acetylmuramoyl-L-alanine amidase/GH25 family lysozyme M1 (1,4-beta-N-acetylmuramidase)|nr:N-acetylmuramoyl-L-alanine amidase [Myxococcales bacterium]